MFVSLYFISINNVFNEILQIHYVAVAAFCSEGVENITHEEQLVVLHLLSIV